MDPLVFIEHYRDLLKIYWRRLLPIVIFIPLVVAAISTAKLIVSPDYASVARVTMLPSESELEFSRGFAGGTRRNQANALSSTYKEYLKSWPVVERAIETLPDGSKATSDAGAQEDPLNRILTFARDSKDYLFSLISLANSGPSAFSDPKAERIRKYQRAIDISSVQGTFILQIETTLSDPYLSADFANALAKAYVERATEQSSEAVRVLKDQLTAEVQLREAMLGDLLEEEFRLRKELGALSLEDKRLSLTNALESERAILMEDRVEKEQLVVRETIFQQKRAELRNRSLLEELDQQIDLIHARSQELDRRIAVRSAFIENLVSDLDVIAELEKPILDLQRKRATLEQELQDLRDPLTSLEISGIGELSQVRIVSPALPASRPSSPQVLLNTVKGFAVGLSLAICGLVLIDITSKKILTRADLRRGTGHEAIGLISGRLAKVIFDRNKGLSRSARRELGKLGSEFERRLSVSGSFGGSSINVTGFGSQNFLSDVSFALALALASTGIEVTCRLPRNYNIAVTKFGDAGRRITILDGDAKVPIESQVHIECLKPIAANLDWRDHGFSSRNLVCAVKSGDMLEESLRQFQDNVGKHNILIPIYLLVDPRGLTAV